MMKSLTLVPATLLVVALAIFFQSCKKDDTKPDNSDYYFTATIDGKSWKVYSGSNDFLGGGQYVSEGITLVAAIKLNNAELMEIVFPTDITLNQPLNFDVTPFTFLGYEKDYNNPNDITASTSGTLTITKFDKTAGIVEGSFNCKAKNTYYLKQINITGKFRVPYIYDFTGTPGDIF